MTKSQIIERILDPGIVAVIRVESSAVLLPICEALLEGGVTALEITMTSPDAIATIAEASRRIRRPRADGRGHGARHGDVPRGDPGRGAVRGDAGVPSGDRGDGRALRQARRVRRVHAHRGADRPRGGRGLHQAFPADQLGPKYIQNMLGPLPMLRIIPTGGVTVETAAIS